MPPAKKRPRTYDLSRTRTAVLAQFAHVQAAVRALTPEQLSGPSGLGEWTVRDLAAHVTTVLERISRELELPEPPGAAPQLTLLEWPLSTAGRAEDIAGDARALAAARPGLAALYEETAERFARLVAGVPGSGS